MQMSIGKTENILDFNYQISLIVTPSMKNNGTHNMLRMFKFIFLILFLILIDCQKDTTPRLPEEHEALVQVYIQLILLQDRIPADEPAYMDSTRKILHAHQYTKEKYENALAFLNEEPEVWEAFYQEAQKRLKKSQSSPDPQPVPPVRRSNNSQ